MPELSRQTIRGKRSELSVGLMMWHLFVKLSVVVLRECRDQMGNQHQVWNETQIPEGGPLCEVYCKMGQRWQVHHTLLNPKVLDKLEINIPPTPSSTKK